VYILKYYQISFENISISITNGSRSTRETVLALEEACNFYNAELTSLKSFTLPSRSTLSAHLHLARSE